MNISQIENNIKSVYQNFNKDTFIYDFLLAYDIPKASIKKLKDGGTNLSKNEGEILWKKKLFFKFSNDGSDLHGLIDDIKGDETISKHIPRFIIVTDFDTFLSIDTKTLETLDIPFQDVTKHFDFFLPLAGMEKAQHQFENPADLKAAERMGKLYDEIKKDNATETEEEVHSLNVFLTRLLFCFFAEDTNIFEDGQFTGSISSHTQQDGSDLSDYFDKLFIAMNTPKDERGDIPAYLNSFPYVNGGLFRDYYQIPSFSRRSRQIIIESGELDWSAINPDIFGSMIQAVITPEHRGGLGMHYTSVPNIMKVIEPLFLNELNEEFDSAKHDPKKLYALLERLGRIKIFDPACGSGNFLIIAYKELRLLEIKILNQLKELRSIATGFEPKQLELIPKQQLTLAASYQIQMFSRVELSQFYGIELDDFAHEVAILSLWLAQHQMNVKFKEIFGAGNPTLPLQTGGNIVHGNATRLDWEEICPKGVNDEIYILGNPPFLGQRNQKKSHQDDLIFSFKGFENYKNLDYVSIWFLYASKYISSTSHKYAFVTTNSITQGTQVDMLWQKIFSFNLEIFFANKNFKWTNNAKDNAGVTVCIIGLRTPTRQPKYLILNDKILSTNHINPYLTIGEKTIVSKRFTMLTDLPKMEGGNQPREGGFLILSSIEKETLLKSDPKANIFLRKLTGSNELLNNIERWCIWIRQNQVEEALKISDIAKRINAVYEVRNAGNSLEKNFVNFSYRFVQNNEAISSQIVIPIVSSESRDYIPIGYLSSEYIVLSSANVIYDPELFVFGVISSKMHNVWAKEVSGKLESRIRYSAGVCYNSFPFPKLSDENKRLIEKIVYIILEEREKYSEKTLAELYDSGKMPQGLKDAHHQLDIAIEKCYRTKPFESDDERLEYLFNLYEQMIEEEKSAGTLFGIEPKPKKKKK
jgi:type II restriction/modification system DNA methylase subunit YeeA